MKSVVENHDIGRLLKHTDDISVNCIVTQYYHNIQNISTVLPCDYFTWTQNPQTPYRKASLTAGTLFQTQKRECHAEPTTGPWKPATVYIVCQKKPKPAKSHTFNVKTHNKPHHQTPSETFELNGSPSLAPIERQATQGQKKNKNKNSRLFISINPVPLVCWKYVRLSMTNNALCIRWWILDSSSTRKINFQILYWFKKTMRSSSWVLDFADF